MSHNPPTFDATAFTCPHCGVLAQQSWNQLEPSHSHRVEAVDVSIATCQSCHRFTLWLKEELIYPDASPAPVPNEDLPDDIRRDYLEAASIVNRSPRGAAALLRLCVQKLGKELGGSGDNINEDIAALVRKGLDVRVQQALDIVRVVGNNAVHPGSLDLRDDVQTALNLFRLVNAITEAMISQPKHVAALFEALPAKSKEAIAKRDQPKK